MHQPGASPGQSSQTKAPVSCVSLPSRVIHESLGHAAALPCSFPTAQLCNFPAPMPEFVAAVAIAQRHRSNAIQKCLKLRLALGSDFVMQGGRLTSIKSLCHPIITPLRRIANGSHPRPPCSLDCPCPAAIRQLNKNQKRCPSWPIQSLVARKGQKVNLGVLRL